MLTASERRGWLRGLRDETREETRRAWEETGGDAERALALTKTRLRARLRGRVGISGIVWSMLIQLAIQLLLEWWNNQNGGGGTVPPQLALECDENDYPGDDFDWQTGGVC